MFKSKREWVLTELENGGGGGVGVGKEGFRIGPLCTIHIST